MRIAYGFRLLCSPIFDTIADTDSITCASCAQSFTENVNAVPRDQPRAVLDYWNDAMNKCKELSKPSNAMDVRLHIRRCVKIHHISHTREVNAATDARLGVYIGRAFKFLFLQYFSFCFIETVFITFAGTSSSSSFVSFIACSSVGSISSCSSHASDAMM